MCTEPSKTKAMASNKSKTLTAWITTFLILSLGLNAYLWIQNSGLHTTTVKQEEEFYELEKVQTELDQDYQAALESLEELRGSNKKMNTLIDEQKSELKEQKEKINNLIWTKRELGKAREEIALLRTTSNETLVELTNLKQKYDIVSAKAAKLENENTLLAQGLNKEKSLTKELETAKAILVSQTENLSSSNRKLSTQVDMAEAIKINYIEVQGYEVKDDGKLKKKKKGKDIEMLRTCFKTETNLVTAAGDKKFYIRIVDPGGKTMAVEDMGSGVLTNKLTNKDVRYTISGTIDYNNKDTEGCFDWSPAAKLAKGEYALEMYNNGFMVGKGAFKLK